MVYLKATLFIRDVPYILGVIEWPEGKRIRTVLTYCDQFSLEIDLEMEVVIALN